MLTACFTKPPKQKLLTWKGIVTISYKLGQLCLCSLLLPGFFTRTFLQLLGGIQLPTHDFLLHRQSEKENTARVF